jgi:hypothetical protein
LGRSHHHTDVAAIVSPKVTARRIIMPQPGGVRRPV